MDDPHPQALYVVSWEKTIHRIWGFQAAKDLILTELVWLWEDYSDPSAAVAFDTVQRWTTDGPWPLRVEAGVPPTWYEMRMG